MACLEFSARVAACLMLLAPATAAAQGPPRVEMSAGAGYVFGGGSEDPGPSLAAYNLSVAFWPFERWGVAARAVRAPGEDLYPHPLPSYERTYLGQEKLSYYVVGTRHRRFFGARHELNIGVGLMLGGDFRTIVLLDQPAGPPVRRSHRDTFFNGFSVEGLWGWRLYRHIGVKGGLTFDFNGETNNLQPVVLAAFSF
jgi:hypothetical protein